MRTAYLLLIAILGLATTASAQKMPPPPKTAMINQWEDIARKLTAMAEAFPEDKYDYKPASDVRSFAQQMLHIAFWNQWAAERAKGNQPDPKPNELSRSEYKTRAAVAKVVRSSFDQAIEVLKGENEDTVVKLTALWSGMLKHAGEHYGQLVIYFRLNGIVPPESAKK